MFNACTSLTTAPELPATNLVNYCYREMFNGCTKLNYIKMLASTTSNTNATTDWVNRVASSGNIVLDGNTYLSTTGTSGIPSGWISHFQTSPYTDKVVTDGSGNSITSDAVYDAISGRFVYDSTTNTLNIIPLS